MRQGRVRLEALVRGHYPGRKLARGALPGVRTVGFWDAAEPQDWGLDWHRNEGLDLAFLEPGSIAFAIDRHCCRMSADDLTFTRPWQPHVVGDPHFTPGRLHWLVLDIGVRRPHQPWQWPPWLVLTKPDRMQLTETLRHNEQPLWRATSEIHGCFQPIAQAVQGDRGGSNVSRLAVYLNELFVLVLDMFRQSQVTLDESLASTRRTVELFWANVRESPEHLARE